MQEGQTLVGGMLYLEVDGRRIDAKGEFTYGLGRPKRTPIIGSDSVHGWSTEVQVPYIEGAVTVTRETDEVAICELESATATLQLQNGKVFVLSQACYAGEGAIKTKESEMGLRLEGLRGEVIK